MTVQHTNGAYNWKRYYVRAPKCRQFGSLETAQAYARGRFEVLGEPVAVEYDRRVVGTWGPDGWRAA